MINALRNFLIPSIAIAVALLVVWYLHLPSPPVTTDMAQVIQEAKDGGYRLIDIESLSNLLRTDLKDVLLIDTRDEWEYRAGHIARSVNFPIAPTWRDRWQKKGALEALLGPDREKSIVFY